MRVSRPIDFEFRTPKRSAPIGKIPTVSKMLALAHYYERLLLDGHIETVTDIALFEAISQQRVSKVMGLLRLSPELQEFILTLPVQFPGTINFSTEKWIQISKEIDFEKQMYYFNLGTLMLTQRSNSLPPNPHTATLLSP